MGLAKRILQVQQIKFLRILAGFSRYDHITNGILEHNLRQPASCKILKDEDESRLEYCDV
jgi:hypothetical protein